MLGVNGTERQEKSCKDAYYKLKKLNGPRKTGTCQEETVQGGLPQCLLTSWLWATLPDAPFQ